MAPEEVEKSTCPPGGGALPESQPGHDQNGAPRPRASIQELAADALLVERVLAAESPALDEFIERMRCIPRLLKMRTRTNPLPPEELKDLAQDVFATIWRDLDSYRGEAPLEGWVHAYCLRTLGNVFRKRARRPKAVEFEELEEPAAPQALELDPRLEGVHAALARLEPDQHQVVLLHAVQGLPYEELGPLLKCSPRAARARYQRALARLRELVATPPSNLEESP